MIGPLPIKRIRIETDDRILAEREDAARMRDAQLSRVPTDVPLLIDLSGLRLITLSAADELFAQWLLVKRNQQNKEDKQALIVAFFSPQQVIHETLHAALAARGLAAYGLKMQADPSEIPEVLGEFTPANDEALQVVQQNPDGITAKELAKRLGLADTAAANRLKDLLQKGLVLRGGRAVARTARGRNPVLFLYPFGFSPATAGVNARAGRPVPA